MWTIDFFWLLWQVWEIALPIISQALLPTIPGTAGNWGSGELGNSESGELGSRG